ncbi:MAG TPA: acyl-CoA dehydrogenase family protein [Ktedonobacterales bacterium]
MHFTKEHEMFRQLVRRFVQEEINPHCDDWEAAGAFPAHDLFKKMGDLGLLGLTYPEEYGGQGLDFWYTAILCEELGRCDAGGVTTGITVHTDMCTPALAKYGTHDLKQRYLAPALKGEMVGCVAISEPDAGSDVAAIRTHARRDGDDWVINGRKLYISNGSQADWACLLARTSEGKGAHGMSLILVPTTTLGFSVGRKLKKMGLWSSDTAELILDNVRVPVANTIGPEGEGFILQMGQFEVERMVAAIVNYSGLERTVHDTITYTRDRSTFGQPILWNQAVQFRLAELLTEIRMVKAFCYQTIERMVAGEQIATEAAMAKLKVGRLAREVTDSCLQFYGGMGYMEETRISRAFRDARALSIAGGADEIMLGIIAKNEGMTPTRAEMAARIAQAMKP